MNNLSIGKAYLISFNMTNDIVIGSLFNIKKSLIPGNQVLKFKNVYNINHHDRCIFFGIEIYSLFSIKSIQEAKYSDYLSEEQIIELLL